MVALCSDTLKNGWKEKEKKKKVNSEKRSQEAESSVRVFEELL